MPRGDDDGGVGQWGGGLFSFFFVLELLSSTCSFGIIVFLIVTVVLTLVMWFYRELSSPKNKLNRFGPGPIISFIILRFCEFPNLV